MDNINLIAKELKLKPSDVKGAVDLIDEGATIPFIARYRKEQTGSMTDENLRDLNDRLLYLRSLNEKKDDIKRILKEQGNLTDKILKDIERAETQTRLDDIYMPFRPKKRTRGTDAKDKGLEPLSDYILDGKENPFEKASEFLTEEVETAKEAVDYAKDIIAEKASERADIRGYLRAFMVKSAVIETSGEEENTPYEMYYEYSERALLMPSHRILAINRGEKENILKVSINSDDERAVAYLEKKYKTGIEENDQIIFEALADSYKRLIRPSLERELRNALTEKAEDQSIEVFKTNLESILMQAPLRGYTVMGFDPGYRTGCKVAILDETGKFLDSATVYPTKPRSDVEGTKRVLKKLIKKHNVDIVSIGNGTASRESEIIIGELLEELKKEDGIDAAYVITNEAGASVYSASKLANDEYPDLDVTIRGAISIARRLQDPMAELVKIDPKSIGIGQYQHDIKKAKLDDSLKGVVESTVNTVGVDLNVSTPSLLSYVSGVSKGLATNIVKHREEIGKYTSRKQLKDVKRLGPKAFEQCAGFLRVRESDEILDRSSVHPESYKETKKILKELGYDIKKLNPKDLKGIDKKARDYGIDKLIDITGLGKPTILDILSELEKPGRDPREDLPLPLLKKGVMEIDDLEEGMILNGTVRNVADFGAFVDIGVHQDGLVHKSELSNSFVKNPIDFVKAGDIVEVIVLSVDKKRNRISLSMKNI